MLCSECSSEVPDDSKFCKDCGHNLLKPTLKAVDERRWDLVLIKMMCFTLA